MAAAFLMEPGRRRTSAEFMREIEEEGIKFSIENTAEDIVNGLFCTYEPPTSKVQQYKAANAVRKNPKKYNVRPSVPKSILKWKVKKNSKKNQATPSAASVAPTVTTVNEGRDDANDGAAVGDKKSVTWRDQKGQKGRTEIENKVVGLAAKYCGGACNNGEDIADILSSPTGRTAQGFFPGGEPETPASMADGKVLYDDSGNPIQEDDLTVDENGSYFPSTPKDSSTPMNRKESVKNGHSNLFCSNIPFMDTVVEGIGIAGVMAASAAVAAGVPENLCSPYVKSKNQESESQETSMDSELKEAKQALGIYEPDSYDQLNSSVKLNRTSTPRYLPASEGNDTEPKEDERSAKEEERESAPSEITMGNSTVKHFSETTSDFDDKTAPAPSPFSSMLGELKKVQRDKGLEGSSQHDSSKIGSLKKGYLKSPRSPVVTRAYLESIKSPKSPGKVADIAKRFESPMARKPIEPVECREFNPGMMSFLPPTPRRKSPGTPVNTDSTSVAPVKKSIEMWERNTKKEDTVKKEVTKTVVAPAAPAESVNTNANTEAEIREAPSSVVDVTAERGDRTEDSGEEKKKSKGGFGKKLKANLRKITRKVESQRIAKED